MTIWTNSDGLEVRFGLDQAQRGMAGVLNANLHEKELRVLIDQDEMPAAAVYVVGGTHDCMIPAGALLQSAKITVTEAFDSATNNSTLTIGLEKKDGTDVDADGIDATIAEAALDTIGKTVACDGALIGTKLAHDSFLIVEVGTAALTSGKAELVIKYFLPSN